VAVSPQVTVTWLRIGTLLGEVEHSSGSLPLPHIVRL
jgi:hypothetical protein